MLASPVTREPRDVASGRRRAMARPPTTIAGAFPDVRGAGSSADGQSGVRCFLVWHATCNH